MFKGTATAFKPSTGNDERIWHPFESNTKSFKGYVRSAAGSQRPAADKVRMPATLLEAAKSLVHIYCEHHSHKDAVGFLLDRVRSIRQDFAFQIEWVESEPHVHDFYLKTMRVIARCLIFAGNSVFQEDELKMLDDALSSALVVLRDEEEFACYDEWIYGTIRRKPSSMFLYGQEQFCLRLFRSYESFDILEKFALARRFLPHAQLRGLRALNIALNGVYSVDFLSNMLHFSDSDLCVQTLKNIGLNPNLDNGNWVVTLKKSNSLDIDKYLGGLAWHSLPNRVKVRVADINYVRSRILKD